ncbi:MAG TPA: hypothetical protein PLL92_02605 [Alicycliphilus sp.]|nr:hypothetical protein [Alicycliphilus sp.]
MSDTDYTRFLHAQWPRQQRLTERYTLADERVWLKRAGPPHGLWRYHLLWVVARVMRLPVLGPVRNLGGRAAIATELSRLRTLGALGLRVPQVLAACDDAFLMSDLGAPGQATPSLGDEIDSAMGAGAVLALWRQGLQTLDAVHERQQCLSQAFARNMVRCPDGAIACIDFEDDPSSTLPLAMCQLRDALMYVHSTALALLQAGAQQEAHGIWRAWLAQPVRSADFHAALQSTQKRLGWLRHLPQDRHWGRDTQRLRAAHDLLMAPY